MKMNTLKHLILVAICAALACGARAEASEGRIQGTVADAVTGQPVIGAAVTIAGTTLGVATGVDGSFALALKPGTYTVQITYISYKEYTSRPLTVKAGEATTLDVALVEQVSELENIVVVGSRPVGTDAGLIGQMRASTVVASGISAQTIARTQDKDASEVVRRIPGISVIDDKFVIVRGLAQRYNNVSINGAAVPGSEADTRAFSFDIIPSAQIDNVMIVKSPAPEIPADFAGGYIRIRTKVVPDRNSVRITYGTGFNTVTQFHAFRYTPGSCTDWLGFDGGKRSIGSFSDRLDNSNAVAVDHASKYGFNNDWRVRSRTPLPDQKLTVAVNRRIESRRGDRVGLAAALNYSNTNKSLLDKENSQFGIYNHTEDRPLYNFRYTDDQYTNDVKLGAMLNLSYVPQPRGRAVSRYELRNIFNQLGRNRYTTREGWRNVSGYYEQQQDEYLYQSRSAYTGQVAGEHETGRTRIDWNAAYSYSNRRQPDRRIVAREKNPENGVYDYTIDQSSVERYFTSLDENLLSGGANLSQQLGSASASFRPVLRAGLYAEYKDRSYDTRNFLYKWDAYDNSLPAGFGSLPAEEIFTPEYVGAPDKLHIQEDTRNTDNYAASNHTEAAYVAAELPVGRFNIYAGARFERFSTTLTSYTSNTTFKTRDYTYTYNNLLPSVNTTFKLTDKQLLRLAYGMSVNRPEFRELSPSTYYDFDMFSTITGNPDLRQATIHNLDLRYELYPGSGEMVSVALFYKRFRNPIEWTYVDAGGSYQYSFENAREADNYGVEVDLRKDLAFMGMRGFMLTLNAAYIHSNVRFGAGSLEHDRPMQGQSPYLVNAGLFYANDRLGLTLGALYNRIGKRITGIGRVSTSGGDNFNNNIPDMYEMPRNVLDLTFGVRLSPVFELKGAVRDILGERVRFMQFPEFRDSAGRVHKREQTTRAYEPGRNVSLSLTATF